MMDELHIFFRLLAVSQAIFLSLYFLSYERNWIGWHIVLVAISFACYLVLPVVNDNLEPYALRLALVFMADCIPAFVWLLGRAFFEDDKPIPAWFWVAWIGYMILWTPEWDVPASDFNSFLFFFFPQLVKLGLVLHVIYLAVAGRDFDLVQKRMELRIPLALGAGAVTAAVILVEISVGGRPSELIEVGGSIILFLFAISANALLFQLRDDLPVLGSRATAVQVAPDEDTSLIEAIEKTMTDGRFYANHGARISDLSIETGIPEYRLRSVINQKLGYKNFNQFLNRYRVDEASDRLLQDNETTILAIALDVGFRSLSSFNKAFRDRQGVTPTEFRSTRSADEIL